MDVFVVQLLKILGVVPMAHRVPMACVACLDLFLDLPIGLRWPRCDEQVQSPQRSVGVPLFVLELLISVKYKRCSSNCAMLRERY